jgi:NADH dehydrogenase
MAGSSGSATERVVIIGAGFAGIEVARSLGKAGFAATLIDRQNYHLFQPLLYQVATAVLSPADIAEPIRKMLRRYPSIEVVLGEVTAIDSEAHHVVLSSGKLIAYDRLVVAAGATHSYFTHEEWANDAPGLKTIEDARTIRSRLLLAFERAEMAEEQSVQRRLMRIAIIGGGPTGVELAGAVAELARYTLAKDFHRIRPGDTEVLLFEAGDRILPAFPESLTSYAQQRLERLGVKVRVRSPVQSVTSHSITVAGQEIQVGLTIWAAGVMASSVGRLLGVETLRNGQIAVGPDFSVPGLDGVYVLGDLAMLLGDEGKPLPGLAQVAKQEGQYLGRALVKSLRTGAASPPFRFHNRGNTAIIGRNVAVFDFGWWRLRGWFAWVFWAIVHVYLLVGFEHRLLVAIQWLWRYVFYESGARLIVKNPENPR